LSVLATLLVLSACSGNTTGATNITSNTATLNAQGQCSGSNSSSPCYFYFQWGTGGQYQFKQGPQGPAGNTGGNVQLSYDAKNLTPSTTYQYQICGKGDGTNSYMCVGPDGGTGTYGQFTTAAAAPTAPANTAPPAISGTARAGQTLSTTPGTWSGTLPLSFAYQWQRCDTSGNSCQNVSGASGATYALGSGDVGSTIRVAVTATNSGGSSSASSTATGIVGLAYDPVVVAVGDVACPAGDTTNSCRQGLTANLASAQHPDAVIPLGDNQYNSGLLSEYNGTGAYNATWGVFNPIVHPDPGNHEYARSSTAAGYFGYFGGATGASSAAPPYHYSYNLGTWHIISLDSDCSDSGCSNATTGQTTSAQTAWLQNDLATHPAACTLAYWHHPRFSASWASDSPGVAPLFSALYNAHADLVLSGHDHVYERYAQVDTFNNAASNGVREIVAGTGGENLFKYPFPGSESTLQVKDATDFGVLVLTLHASSYDWAFKRLDGTVVDSGSTPCHGSGTGSTSARAARDSRLESIGPTGRRLTFDARPQSATLATVERHGLSVAVSATRAPNVTIAVSVRRGRHMTRIASFYETETEISGPHSRIVLPLPARWLKGKGSVTVTVRFVATAAGQRRVVTRTVVLSDQGRGAQTR